MSKRNPLVTNAADPKQRRFAEHIEKQRGRRRGQILHAIMNTEAGRAFVWSELRRHEVFGAAFNRDALVMAFNEGRSDTGRELMAEVVALDNGKLYLLMESEGRTAEAQEQSMIDAVHTESVTAAEEGES